MSKSEIDRFTRRLQKAEPPARRMRALPGPFAPPPKKLTALAFPAFSTERGRKDAAALAKKWRGQIADARNARLAAAAMASPAGAKTLANEVRGRLAAAEALRTLPPIFGRPEQILLKAPYLIWPSEQLVLDGSEIVDGQSFARFRVAASENFLGRVRFFYYWTNSGGETAVIDIMAMATFHGANDAEAEGGIPVPQGSRNVSALYATLEVHPVWDPSIIAGGDIWYAFSAYIIANSLFEQNEVSNSVQTAVPLKATQLAVPPNRTVVFTVTFLADVSLDGSGQTVFDYASEGFSVGSPFALVTVTARYPVLQPSL